MSGNGAGYPPRGNLRKMMDQQPLPTLAPGMIDQESMAGEEPTKQAKTVLDLFNAAVASNDVQALEDCFYSDQAFWKDSLALTYHLRTFNGPEVIASSFLETEGLRGIPKGLEIDGRAIFMPATPVLQFIDCPILFHTETPAASCGGKIILLPVHENGSKSLTWKIWILSTRLDNLDIMNEDERLLKSPGINFDQDGDMEADVFIIGGGNAAATLSARLKALGVLSVMAERNNNPGDNWALRYDCMRFHVPTSFCDMPYMPYDESLRTPHLLSRDDLASQVRRYIETFNLNTINSAQIEHTQYDENSKTWQIQFTTPSGRRKASAKQLVLATGVGSQKPNVPQIGDRDLFKGTVLHSTQFKNAKLLKEQGIKSVVVVGSANTAFDVMQDCYDAGLKTTLVVRSPTYIVPTEYVTNQVSLGAYDGGVEFADKLFNSLPTCVDSQLGRGLFQMFASQEPERYAALEKAGFPVLDSRDPTQSLVCNLLETAGGHYMDVGNTNSIAEGKVAVRAIVEPLAYTTTGLRMSDGSKLDTEAVLWCTGFSDRNVSEVAEEILSSAPSVNGTLNEVGESHLGPAEIASRMDNTWGVDSEGEICGMWKRHRQLENFWIMGGFTSQHRWHSRTLALQIKAALEGILPPAYLDTPSSKTA